MPDVGAQALPSPTMGCSADETVKRQDEQDVEHKSARENGGQKPATMRTLAITSIAVMKRSANTPATIAARSACMVVSDGMDGD